MTNRLLGTMAPEWIPLPMTAAPEAFGGQRLSQVVFEDVGVPTPTKQHIKVTLERTSTGGTRHEAQFKRAASGPMSGAERAEKKRKRAALFPQQQAAVRDKDVQRKRQAAAAKVAAAMEAAAEQAWQEHEQGYWAARLEEEFWAERATPYWATPCCGFRMEHFLLRRLIKACRFEGIFGQSACQGCGDRITAWNCRPC
jgi:hypothetical protein